MSGSAGRRHKGQQISDVLLGLVLEGNRGRLGGGTPLVGGKPLAEARSRWCCSPTCRGSTSRRCAGKPQCRRGCLAIGAAADHRCRCARRGSAAQRTRPSHGPASSPSIHPVRYFPLLRSYWRRERLPLPIAFLSRARARTRGILHPPQSRAAVICHASDTQSQRLYPSAILRGPRLCGSAHQATRPPPCVDQDAGAWCGVGRARSAGPQLKRSS